MEQIALLKLKRKFVSSFNFFYSEMKNVYKRLNLNNKT